MSMLGSPVRPATGRESVWVRGEERRGRKETKSSLTDLLQLATHDLKLLRWHT